MDKITDKIAALSPESYYFSLEFFPPKTSMGFANLRGRLDRMARALRPLFVNVTWGAGGSTAQKSLELAEICQRELGLTTCLHLTCTNMSRELIDKALEDAKALGIRNILALRGDPPRPTEYSDETDKDAAAAGIAPGPSGELAFSWAVDLVRYIRKQHGDYFCIGVAAYPEGHAEESHPLGQSLEHDLPYLVEKVQAGADFVMTQLFFDHAAYAHFESVLLAHPSGAFKDIPLIPGLMPIQNYQMIKRTTKLSHARIPDELMARLDAVKKDDEQVKSVGVDIISELVEEVKEIKDRTRADRPKGFHFYTLNLEKAVSFILERTHLIPPGTPDEDEEAIAGEVAVVDDVATSGSLGVPSIRINGSTGTGGAVHPPLDGHPARRQSSIGSDPRNRVIVSGRAASHPDYEATALEASVPAEPVNTRSNTLAISEGEGVLGREATWDDFPNGRWGDARSPAYGEIDGYGVSLHMTVNQALKLWGRPTTTEDINAIFIRYLGGELAAIPWSEEEFNPETATIRDQLVQLNAKGWWTVASQPAVNGIPSTDATFGWGPTHGFVFQKAFVEFFLPSADWAALCTRLTDPEVRDKVCFYAINAAGDFVSSDASGRVTDGRGGAGAAEEASTNAVTWGVFPGKEIVTPTIVEEVSFRAWSEEAFGIWKEWAALYPKGSPTDILLEKTRNDYWLVNIIHHNYIEKDSLWNLVSA
ncbi:methylenetetrahydrofolate reductase (NADPH) [Sporothrix brasiliensis 5110]|uniref:Methylenetetrahydrofolate reductase (NADPH) n=1 Tax=Sporothrix brasiliensis 5110 TaxID=1398154 RepID=A0A0C2FBD5_9PEZI|nr:methylenetetrahydrofolate reductase (NADPH) [Sporothrix brasiliensis 5110]KIH88403.1 methylenetetrahydrofolate reductase (NADPH) [Sporothrix brasiliensis 5110]